MALAECHLIEKFLCLAEITALQSSFAGKAKILVAKENFVF
jgi:hypothetical protein